MPSTAKESNVQSFDPDNYVDITEELFSSLNQITDKKVVAHANYQLFEGTRAVEVGYDKLDTSMIGASLSEEEINFDVTEPQLLEAVLGTMDKLICLAMTWLTNSSLPTTFLSCRYVQSILEKYDNNGLYPKTSLEDCIFEDKRILNKKGKNGNEDSDSPEYYNTHTVLRAFVIGLAKFIDICLNVNTGYLYDEEDFTSRAMEFSFFRDIHDSDIRKLVNDVVALEIDQRFKVRLNLVGKLLKIYDLLNGDPIQIFQNFTDSSNGKDETLTFLIEADQVLFQLNEDFFKYESSIPKGCFSKFIQQDLNNVSIPAELVMIEPLECIENYKTMFKDLYHLVHLSKQITNSFQLESFLEFEIAHRAEQFNVFVRGFYLSIFLMDNVHILKSSLTVKDVMKHEIDAFCTRDSLLFQPDSWSVNEQVKQTIGAEFDQLFHDIEVAMFHKLTRPTNNRCRQRQLANKFLLIWDTLQVASESQEMKIWTSYNIGDEIEGNEPGLPISSYIYFRKLEEMITILLRGFELDLYKDFEICQMYWYVSYLSKLIIDHLKNRVQEQIKYRIQNITTGLSKKIKKLKAGDKKQQLKNLQKYKQDNIIPQLQQSLLYNEKYICANYSALHNVCEGIKQYLVILDCLKIFKNERGPKLNSTSMEAIYNLRMKPFSSIGVPSLPTYSQYKNSISFSNTNQKDLLILYLSCVKEFKAARDTYQGIITFIEDNSGLFLGENIRKWFMEHCQVCEYYL